MFDNFNPQMVAMTAMMVGPMVPLGKVFMCNVFNCQPADPLSTSIGGPPLPEGNSLGGVRRRSVFQSDVPS